MKEEALSWTLTIMHTFSELSDPFCIHRSNYKERKKKKKRKNNSPKRWQRERGKINSDNSFCQELLTAAVWQQEINVAIYLYSGDV